MSEFDELERTADGRFRVGIVLDDYPDAPFDDGASPVLELSWRGTRWIARDVEHGTYRFDPYVLESFVRAYAVSLELLHRYARITLGATTFDYCDTRDCVYVTCDPAEWRESVGAPEGAASLAEWRAYVEGDVWGIVVQRRTVWTSDDGRTCESWDTVNSLWGFYGLDSQRDYVESTARELLESAAADWHDGVTL